MKLPKFILEFLMGFKNKNKIMKEVRPMPVKLMLKSINHWMTEKAMNSNDFKNVSFPY